MTGTVCLRGLALQWRGLAHSCTRMEPRAVGSYGQDGLVDELARWAETVGRDGGPRSWAVIDDAALRDEFIRVYSEKIGRSVPSESLRIERAHDGVRVSYSGGTLEMTDPSGDEVDVHEAVTNAALTLAQIERDNEYS